MLHPPLQASCESGSSGGKEACGSHLKAGKRFMLLRLALVLLAVLLFTMTAKGGSYDVVPFRAHHYLDLWQRYSGRSDSIRSHEEFDTKVFAPWYDESMGGPKRASNILLGLLSAPTDHGPPLPRLQRRRLTALNSSSSKTNLVVDVLFQTSGEMGNHLWHLAVAHALSRHAMQEHGIKLNITFTGQRSSKGRSTAKLVRKCFPELSTFDSNVEIPEAEFQEAHAMQQAAFPALHADFEANFRRGSSAREVLEQFNSSLRAVLEATQEVGKKNISSLMPHAYVRIKGTGAWKWPLVEGYRFELLRKFRMSSSCCTDLHPQSNETVLHIRGFEVEMATHALHLGFGELSPNRVSHDLLGHLGPGSSVIIVSRFTKHESIDDYESSLRYRGFNVRVLHDLPGPETFCYLRHATALAGFWKTTFFSWAAFLSDAERIDVYRMDTNHTRIALRREGINEEVAKELMSPDPTAACSSNSRYHTHVFRED